MFVGIPFHSSDGILSFYIECSFEFTRSPCFLKKDKACGCVVFLRSSYCSPYVSLVLLRRNVRVMAIAKMERSVNLANVCVSHPSPTVDCCVQTSLLTLKTVAFVATSVLLVTYVSKERANALVHCSNAVQRVSRLHRTLKTAVDVALSARRVGSALRESVVLHVQERPIRSVETSVSMSAQILKTAVDVDKNVQVARSVEMKPVYVHLPCYAVETRVSIHCRHAHTVEAVEMRVKLQKAVKKVSAQ